MRGLLERVKAFHDRDSGCNGFTADYEILRRDIDAALNTMSAATDACQATPAKELERQIMSASVAKNEREWWAAREIERLRNLEAALHTAPDGRFTEGVSGDGVVILNDGLPLTISEVLALLNHRDPLTLESEFQRIRLRDALQSIANNTCCDKCQEAALVAHAALNPA